MHTYQLTTEKKNKKFRGKRKRKQILAKKALCYNNDHTRSTEGCFTRKRERERESDKL